ncbi:hypothetical protein GCM10010306_103620 [Streptomyces umbrinus]|uniref:hypothetical protein n=1 Tax=Streptomyces umbrinus TaxID=67370 RepID=UPI001672747B|nr:hypothetical protein [Streptomyces umbrinus]GHB91673.1 hypothetical protein GCM10010306_103620 [Streptomyces umbrinus]
MRRYRVEIRGTSFYLARTAVTLATRETRHRPILPAPDLDLDLDAILAALDQVTEHPDWGQWRARGRPA